MIFLPTCVAFDSSHLVVYWWLCNVIRTCRKFCSVQRLLDIAVVICGTPVQLLWTIEGARGDWRERSEHIERWQRAAMELGTPPKYGTEASALTAHHAAVDVHVFGNRNVSGQRRSNFLLLLFRALSFCFSLAAVVVMGTNKHDVRGTLSKVAWYDYDPYRWVYTTSRTIWAWSMQCSWGSLFFFQTQKTLRRLSKYFSLQDPQRTLQICRSSSHFKIHNEHCRFAEVLLS